MKYALLIAWREYAENARTKGFWIGIAMFPIMILLMATVPQLLHKNATPTRYFVLVDQSGEFEKQVEAGLDAAHQKKVLQELDSYAAKHAISSGSSTAPTPSDISAGDGGTNANPVELRLAQLRPLLKPNSPEFSPPARAYQRVPLSPELSSIEEINALAQALKPYLRGDSKFGFQGNAVSLYAAILIPHDIAQASTASASPAGSKGIEYWSANLADLGLRSEMEKSVNDEIRRREYIKRGLDQDTIKAVQNVHAPIATLNPKKEEGKETVGMADFIKQWAPSVFVYLLWLAIFVIMQMLLNNTVEEKSNRIIEVLLSSVTPGELMMGKLIGIAGIGLTMVGAWVLSMVLVLLWVNGAQPEVAAQAFSVLKGSYLLPAFAFYFVLGYVMYSGIILSIGSMCTTIKETQNLMGVVSVAMIVPLLTMTFIPRDPNGTLATVLSWIPIYTPFVMMNRAMADPPLFDVIGTLVLSLAFTGGVLWMSGKIFRIGILRTGQPPKLMELIRWLRN